jgi:S1-C subfamily serine protease
MPVMPPGGFWDGNAPLSSLTGSGALIGIEGENLSPQLAEYFGVKDGVLVRTVGPKTPAERAGLKAGDIVTKVNGTPVTSPREILGLVRAKGAKMFSFTVVRNKKEISLNVEISEVRLPVIINDVFLPL